MGQAQLLLIVLGVVLVGIAIIAGIQAYDANNRKASVDALTHDGIRLANDLQLWVQKPTQFGGPATRGDWSTLTDAATLGYVNAAGLAVTNTNGTCTLAVTDPATVTCSNEDLGTAVRVQVAGVADTDITVAASTMEGGEAGLPASS